MKREHWGIGLAVALLAAGCGASPSAPITAAVAVANQKATPPAPSLKASSLAATSKPGTPSVMPRVPEAGPPLAPLAYEPKGRRDPFNPVTITHDKGGVDVAATKLVGVIEGGQLLALVEAPDGLGYILKPGDVLGNGRVRDVTLGTVTFAVAGRGNQQQETSLTLRLVR